LDLVSWYDAAFAIESSLVKTDRRALPPIDEAALRFLAMRIGHHE